MAKILVTYFSTSGVTKKVAERVARIASADLFEIEPKRSYTREDLNWMNKQSRSSIEMNNSNSRPEIKSMVENIERYDTIIIGFPIWWYTAPTIIKSFLESYDFSNKKIALFATSGGSGFGNTVKDLLPCVDDTTRFISEKVMNGVSDDEIKNWIMSII